MSHHHRILMPNILLVAGSGRNSGKTSMTVAIIRKFAGEGIIAVKITSHPHPETGGLEVFMASDTYRIFLEKEETTGKDSAKMLRAGARKVFLIHLRGEYHYEAFLRLLDTLKPDIPIICESPALAYYLKAGVLIYRQGLPGNTGYKDNADLRELADLVVPWQESGKPEVPAALHWQNGKWCIC